MGVFVMVLPHHNRHKFQLSARACVFLGYPAVYNVYKFLDLESNRIFISRNVVFHEEVFPLASHSKDQYTTGFFTPSKSESQLSLFLLPHPTQNSSSLPSLSPEISPRESTSQIPPSRQQKPPNCLQDLHCYSSDSSHLYPIASYLSYSQSSDDHKIFINSISSIPSPQSYAKACQSKERCEAADTEIDAMEITHTWDIMSLSPCQNEIGCKWVFTLNFNADGTLERHKAHLVGKGYTQKEVLDYTETFSLVAKMATIKLLIKVSASKKWVLRQLDVSNPFLNGELDEEIFMHLSNGCSKRKGDSLPPNVVCRLRKSIYGLKHSYQ